MRETDPGPRQQDITIKISDEGGGIPRSALPLVWTWMYVTRLDHVSTLADSLR